MQPKNAFEHHPRTAHTPVQRSWKGMELELKQWQQQIAQASQRGERATLYRLQQDCLASEAARWLAVRRVTETNAGKHTAGVDGVKSLSPVEQQEMVEVIHPRNWKTQPVVPARRVWIPKPGAAEWRPLAILPMLDRCKQALVKLVLEPEWEVRFEEHSYGFRPNRSTQDAIAAILVALKRRPAFVFATDIAKAFDTLDQAKLLEKLQTAPALRDAIRLWLRAGVMDKGQYHPGETGIPQGGALSPLLLNIALHGMEDVVRTGATGEPPLFVRYADNFVLVHPERQEVQRAVQHLTPWLAHLGLQLKEEKTHFTHTLQKMQGQVGLDFLGFHLHQEEDEAARSGQNKPGLRLKTIVVPTQEAHQRHLATLDQRLQELQGASEEQVIVKLNPLIAGFAAYYVGLVEPATLSRYNGLLEQRLLAWANHRHPGRNREWLLARYWRSGPRTRQFVAPDGTVLRQYGQ
jgi:RNA-directed DNA polymerase